MIQRQLSEEDQARVDTYLQRPIHQVDRQPFRPWLLMAIIVLVMTILSGLSYLLAYVKGLV